MSRIKKIKRENSLLELQNLLREAIGNKDHFSVSILVKIIENKGGKIVTNKGKEL